MNTPNNALPGGMAHLNDQLDEALKETFPASDPVAIGIERPWPEYRMTTIPKTDPLPQDSQYRETSETTRTQRVPGSELPGFVYRSVAWICVAALLVVWLAFDRNAHIGSLLFIVTLLLGAALGLPAVLAHMGKRRTQSQKVKDFLSSEVDTATERLTGAQAWTQILIIPLSLVLATILIGIVYVFVT
ncbi:MAG: hypothetical protein WBX25_16790 [Rhodomicrobium sp.]